MAKTTLELTLEIERLKAQVNQLFAHRDNLIAENKRLNAAIANEKELKDYGGKRTASGLIVVSNDD